MGKISNVTNSNDPQAISSRIFVGNLNTFALTKDDIENVFKRYGKIIGISMHKGYAFIQYTNEVESRNAVAGEDQRVYAGQPIDVNLAAEPKPNRPNRKRPQGAGSEWDYYYNVPIFPSHLPLQVSLAKRPRADLPPPPLAPIIPPATVVPHINKRTLVQVGAGGYLKTAQVPRKSSYMRTTKAKTDDSDILICGSCKQMFADIDQLTSHKRIRCKLRFVCRCQEENASKADKTDADEPDVLTCATCQESFTSAWALCRHCQHDHQLNIYTGQTNASERVCCNISADVNNSLEGKEQSGASVILLNSRDHDPVDHGLPLTQDNGLSSPDSGSLSSDVSSIDYNENAPVRPNQEHLVNGIMTTNVPMPTTPTVVNNG